MDFISWGDTLVTRLEESGTSSVGLGKDGYLVGPLFEELIQGVGFSAGTTYEEFVKGWNALDKDKQEEFRS